jgi:hypothetical protein
MLCFLGNDEVLMAELASIIVISKDISWPPRPQCVTTRRSHSLPVAMTKGGLLSTAISLVTIPATNVLALGAISVNGIIMGPNAAVVFRPRNALPGVVEVRIVKHHEVPSGRCDDLTKRLHHAPGSKNPCLGSRRYGEYKRFVFNTKLY